MQLCVLGLGYIGLPTASLFATNGLRVQGVDVSPSIVETINRGAIHIEEPGLKTIVQAAIHSGCLKAGLKPEPADVFILAVPTPFTEDKKADMRYVEDAARSILPVLRPGNLVVLESTSPPGTCRDRLAPIFEEAGFVIGETLHLAHCPERVLPGQILKELIGNHRVVGGMTPACARKARELYAQIVSGEIHLTDATTAEMVKVMENTYRDVNIALANELAKIAESMRISAWEVVRLANLHPRVSLHQPGPGVGGHCISVDPWFIVEQAPETAKLIRLARDTNDGMPAHVVALARALAPAGSKITLLGAAYKGNVDDARESPSLEVAHLLREAGFRPAFYDPHVKSIAGDFEPLGIEEAFRGAELVVLLTPHNEFRYVAPGAIAPLLAGKRLLDTRHWLDAGAWEAAGFEVSVLGDGRGRQAAAEAAR